MNDKDNFTGSTHGDPSGQSGLGGSGFFAVAIAASSR
jgi:hypothetical protein